MIELAVLLGVAGFAGSYVVTVSELFEGFQARWVANKNQNYNLVDLAEQAQTDPVRRRLVWLTLGKFWHGLSCPTCAGWHANWIVMLVWQQLGGFPLEEWGTAFVTWLMASGLHTVLMRAALKYGLFDD